MKVASVHGKMVCWLGDVERMRQLDGFALLLSRYMLLVNFRSMSRLVRTCSADDKAAYISRYRYGSSSTEQYQTFLQPSES